MTARDLTFALGLALQEVEGGLSRGVSGQLKSVGAHRDGVGVIQASVHVAGDVVRRLVDGVAVQTSRLLAEGERGQNSAC